VTPATTKAATAKPTVKETSTRSDALLKLLKKVGAID
jgi:hypothetical protein